MHSEPSTPQKPRLWHRLKPLKALLMAFTMVGLVGSNVASLVSHSAHDWMQNALRKVLSLGGQTVADRAMANSPREHLNQVVKARTADLESRNKQLLETNELQTRQLNAAQAHNQKLAHQLETNGKQAKETVSAVHKRLAKGVARNVAALPSEAIPYLGVGVTLAVTSLDIYDACQTMKDFNALLQAMGQGEEQPDLCGQKVPTVEQVLAAAKTEWRSSVQSVADEAKSLKINAPEIRLPARDELAKVVCVHISIPYLCQVR
jgi:hypothetical protein